MWIYCDICGAVVNFVDLHADWHAARGDLPPITPTPEPDPDPVPEEVVTDGDQPT
ncbi:hypothetical protein [Oerskovia enterophila]|uniref:Uncharacterized protein n=1 Tax=Oerskovia enterophila TaxID=43678 RepID=A0A163QUQ9_9CELL|nr:hypothetical protein [Oerskovia enterophila]KZM34553.1 hypothetical protein OJAG_28520 [Oerskovia enterophila]